MTDELQLVRELRPDVPLPDPADLEPARSRLLVAAHAAPPLRAVPGRRVRPVRRAALAAGLAGLAAGVAAVLVVVTGGPSGEPPGGVAPPPLTTDPSGQSPPPAVELVAADVLRRAAAAAAAQPATTPRPDQFVFVETVGEGGYHRSTWHSVDDTRDGLIRQPDGDTLLPGCRDGLRAGMRGTEVVGFEPCTPRPAFDPDLPTDAAAMADHLRTLGGTPGDVNGLGKNVLVLAEHTYLLPQTRAALYEAALTIPGIEADPDEVDATGRPGVGVAWSGPSGGRHVLIFDQTTYAYLGSAYTAPGATATSRTAVLHLTIVDNAGQLP